MFRYAQKGIVLILKAGQARGTRCCAATTKRLLLFLLLVGSLGLLGGLGLGFAFGTFLAFDFLLALLDDFGLGWSRGFRGHGFDGLLFFDLESDDVGENLLGIGEQLQLACVNL